MERLAINSKPTYEVCDSKSENEEYFATVQSTVSDLLKDSKGWSENLLGQAVV